MISRLHSFARRGATMLRAMGPLGFLRRAVLWGRRRLGWLPAGEAEWHERQRAADAAFDAANGVATGGVESLDGLTILGPNAAHGINYVPSHPAEVEAVLDVLAIDPAGFDFVDLGSGKGRVLILAARRGFRSVTGVEFAAELHAAAEANLAALPLETRERIRLVHGDAAAFDWPSGPLVVFMFNPFGETVSRAVARSLAEDRRRAPRPVHVLYLNPLQAAAWEAEGWTRSGAGQGWIALSPGP